MFIYKGTQMIHREKLEQLMYDGNTEEKIAEYFGVNKSTIVRAKRKYKLSSKAIRLEKYPKELNNIQNKLIIASLLGDGMIEKSGRFRLKLKLGSEEYLKYYNELFKPFSSEIKYDESSSPSGTICQVCLFYTCQHPIFKELRKTWYPNDKKIVPKVELDAEMIAHLYLQDGQNHKTRKSINIHTRAFTEEEVKYLCNQLSKFNIKSHPYYHKINKGKYAGHGGWIIFIGAGSYFDFIELVKPYITFNCFQYKIDITGVEKGDPNRIPGKLNMEKAQEIRILYESGKMNQNELADKYNVSQSAIGHILRNEAYKITKEQFDEMVKLHYNGNGKFKLR